MIYLTGDTHGDIDVGKISNNKWKVGSKLSRDDYLIILGDFGFPFLPTDVTNEKLDNKIYAEARKSYLYWIKWLSQRPYTILWVDGNHDNHVYWDSVETEEWHGGKVNRHPLADNVIHLKRGEYYEIDGHTFWVMGGAMSHDKELRVPGFSWWEQEIPNYTEMDHGLETLASHGNKVDFILTHTMPEDLIPLVLGLHFNECDPTRMYLNSIYRDVAFQYWFCGHYHCDTRNDMCHMQVLYDDIVPLSDYVRVNPADNQTYASAIHFLKKYYVNGAYLYKDALQRNLSLSDVLAEEVLERLVKDSIITKHMQYYCPTCCMPVGEYDGEEEDDAFCPSCDGMLDKNHKCYFYRVVNI